MTLIDFPTPDQVTKELEYLRMEERETERILRQGEIRKAERRRQLREWIIVTLVIAGIVLTMKFCGFGGAR